MRHRAADAINGKILLEQMPTEGAPRQGEKVAGARSAYVINIKTELDMNRCFLWLQGWFCADARVAYAAPDMLEALVQCRAVMRTALAETDDETAKRVFTRKIELATAAINKAGGPSKYR